MHKFMTSKTLVQVVVLVFVLGMNASVFAADPATGRLIPKSKVSIFDGTSKTGELSSEAPLPTGKILASDQRFAVTIPGVYLVAEPEARLAVRPFPNGKDIYVESGVVYFALGSFTDTLTFSTPQDTVTVESVVITASTATPVVKGYVSYVEEQMEIGVIDGGKLLITNAKGQQVIDAGNGLKIYKAQADLGGAAGGAAGIGTGTLLVLGGTAAAFFGGAAALGAFDGDGGGGGGGIVSQFEPN